MKKVYSVIFLLFLGVTVFAQQYEFDNSNRISKITYINGQEVFFVYDVNGVRKSKTSNSNVSLEEVIPNEAVNIFPNPDTYELNIQFIYNEYDSVTVQFSSVSGEVLLIKRLKNISDNSTQVINVLALPMGSYILQIIADNQTVLLEKVNISDDAVNSRD